MKYIYFVLTVLTLLTLGCGVKGDPLPPEYPPELGRGRPTYRGATKGLKIQLEEDEEDEDREDEE